MSITYQQHEAHARAVRQGHQGRTSRGLSVEIARFALNNPIFGDDLAELLADLQRCAADCIGAGCEPRFSLPGEEFHSRIAQIRLDHNGRTSRGLAVEISRIAFQNPLFSDNQDLWFADLQRCAADCIGAGCEPRFRPLPGQSAGVARLAAAAHADQVEGTPARKQAQGTCFFPRPLGKSWLVSVEFLTGARAGEIFEIRWYKRSDALLCKRNFKSPPGLKLSRVTIRECLGYSTWDGWVDVPFGQEAIA